MVKQTKFIINELLIGYEILEDGYGIYFGDGLTITQNECNLPYPNLPFELNAILQIKDLCGVPYDLEEEVRNSTPLTENEQMQLDLALKVEYLICLAELDM